MMFLFWYDGTMLLGIMRYTMHFPRGDSAWGPLGVDYTSWNRAMNHLNVAYVGQRTLLSQILRDTRFGVPW